MSEFKPRWWNPWATIRNLRNELERAWMEAEHWEGVADRADERAFRNAAEHYYQRSKMIEAQNQHLAKQIAEISSLTLKPLYMVSSKDHSNDPE